MYVFFKHITVSCLYFIVSIVRLILLHAEIIFTVVVENKHLSWKNMLITCFLIPKDTPYSIDMWQLLAKIFNSLTKKTLLQY